MEFSVLPAETNVLFPANIAQGEFPAQIFPNWFGSIITHPEHTAQTLCCVFGEILGANN
jgi:hypothetical protein